MEWLKAIAPTIATALGGPFGGLAYEAISHVLGISQDDAKKMLDEGKLTSDQIASVQQAEITLKAKAQELNLDFDQLAVSDRKSARDMQSTTRSFMPGILAVLVVTAWITIQYFMFTHVIDNSMRELISRILGTLDAALMLVLGFYFGSSSSHEQSTQLLYQSTPNKDIQK